MLRINAAALKPKLHIVAGGMHNDTWLKAGKQYVLWLRAFLANPLQPFQSETTSGET